jgi:Putative DNA-binding domain
MSNDGAAKEALRQQMLLRALWRESGAGQSLRGWLRGGDATERGLAAYRANAGAVAERALGVAFPTIAALLGDESFAALARDFWQRRPPQRGDLGHWGDALPAFIADQESLADEPYLPDSARLDWAWHAASRAADAPADAPALERLADTDPSSLRLVLAPGSALITSAWPIASIRQAHQRSDEQRFDAVRIALAERRGEHAFVVRQGLAVQVHAQGDADAAFTRALLSHESLARALDAAPPSFAFDRWLAQALAERWLVAITPVTENAP